MDDRRRSEIWNQFGAAIDMLELDPAGLLPDRVYTREELRTYLARGRQKCRRTIVNLTEDEAGRNFVFGWGEVSFGELLLYNLRHVQHGVGQLNLLLRQEINSSPRWVAKSKGHQDPIK